MTDDEQAIRGLVSRWHAATRDGDTSTVLSLMTDDALFLTPGRAPMTQTEFASLAAQGAAAKPRIEIDQQILELEVFGEWAFMRSQLAVSVTPAGSASPMRRSGQTLTIFKKQGDRWLLFRDANLLAPAVAAMNHGEVPT